MTIWDDHLVGELLCVFLQRMGAGYAQLVWWFGMVNAVGVRVVLVDVELWCGQRKVWARC